MLLQFETISQNSINIENVQVIIRDFHTPFWKKTKDVVQFFGRRNNDNLKFELEVRRISHHRVHKHKIIQITKEKPSKNSSLREKYKYHCFDNLFVFEHEF